MQLFRVRWRLGQDIKRLQIDEASEFVVMEA
jgi:hypothetical protein